MNLDYYTVGGGEYIDFALRALQILLGDSAFGTLVRVVFLWGMIWAIVLSVFGWQYRTLFIKHMAVTFFALNVFFMPVVNLTVTDTKTGQVYAYENVPFVPGFAMSFFSNLSRYLTDFFESIGHSGTVITWGSFGGAVPVQVDYSNTGFAGMFDYYRVMLKIDPALAATQFEAFDMLNTYLEKCYLPYTYALPENEIQQTLTSTDLISRIRIDTSLLMNYRGNTYTCTEFYDNFLRPAWDDFVISVSIDPLLLSIAPYQVATVTSAVNALTNASHNFSTIVSQAGIINTMKYLLSTYTFGDGTSILAQYAKARTEEQSMALGKAFGIWVKENLPLLKNFLEAFIIFLLPLTGLVMLMPFPGPRLILGYLQFLAWVYLWDPILAILDTFIKMSAIAQAQAWLASQSTSGLSLVTYGYIMEQAQWFPAIAGYIGLTAPMWAWAVLKGFEVSVYGLNYMIGNMGANMLNQEMTPQRLSQLIHEERMAREAGFLNAGEASWFASGYTSAQMTAQGWWNRALGSNLFGGMVGGMAHSIGRGMATYNANNGDVVAMLNSGALGAPARNYVDPVTGMLTRQYSTIDGTPVKVGMEGAIETTWNINAARQRIAKEMKAVDKQLEEAYREGRTITSNLVAQAVEGKGLATVFKDSDTYKEAAQETGSSAIQTAYEIHRDLVKTLRDEFKLSQEDAEKLATQLLFDLNQQANAKDIKGKIVDFFKGHTGVSGKAIGELTDKFIKSDAFQRASQFAQSDQFQTALKDMVAYTESKLADESWSKEKGFTEEERAQLLTSLGRAIEWARNVSKLESYKEQYEKAYSFLSSFNEDLNHRFLMWYAAKKGLDNLAKAGQELNKLYYNNSKKFVSLVNDFINQVATGDEKILNTINDRTSYLINAVGDTEANVNAALNNADEKVKNAYKVYANGIDSSVKQEVIKQLEQGNVLKTNVRNNREQIQMGIAEGGKRIDEGAQKVGPDKELLDRQQDLHEAHKNPLKMLGHMWEHGPGHRVIMGATLAPYALEVGARTLEHLGKLRFPGGGGGNVPYGRFNWIGALVEGAGTVMRMPVTSAGGMAGTIAFAPLVGLGTYTITRYAMENITIGGKNLDTHFYEKVFEPLADWIGNRTGWWETVNKNR